RRLWRELEDASGEVLLDEVGAVEHGVDQTAIDQFVALLGQRRVAHEVLAPEVAAERWPGMRFDGRVLFQPGGGCIYAERAVSALQRLAVTHGASLLSNHEVQSIRPATSPASDAVEIVTSQGVFHALRVVVTAGPWTPRVLSGQVELPQITATREQPRHFAVRDPGQPWPCFVQWRHGPGPYGKFESYGLSEGSLGVKVGLHASGPVMDPDHKDSTQDPGVEQALLDYVQQWFPGLDPQSSTTNSCLYDNPETNRFIIDTVGPITLAAGFHGQGFKFVPVMGELLRDLAFSERTPPAYFSLAAHRQALSASS
ncbi:MAG: FAD-dependent oxidoreductase, partial [Candidatus Nanopelagicales bacterium]